MCTPARRFWPPTKHRLFYANLVVYGAVLLLLVAYHGELIWAQRTLRGFIFSGAVPPPADMLLTQRAVKLLEKGENLQLSRRLLQRALQIDPYSQAELWLGDCYLRLGDTNKMLLCYDRYRAIDPSFIGIYTNMTNVLAQKQDHRAIGRLVEEGIEYFRRRIELYKPYCDSTVPDRFNQKSLDVYKTSQEGLELLEKIQQQLKDSQ